MDEDDFNFSNFDLDSISNEYDPLEDDLLSEQSEFSFRQQLLREIREAEGDSWYDDEY
jgi:hypothetical protein